MSLEKLFKDHALQLPQLPGFSWKSWLSDQTDLLHTLGKKAFRNRLMDCTDTVPFDLEAQNVYRQYIHMYKCRNGCRDTWMRSSCRRSRRLIQHAPFPRQGMDEVKDSEEPPAQLEVEGKS